MYSYVLWPNPEPRNELLLKWLKSSFSSVKLDLKQLWCFVDHLSLLLLLSLKINKPLKPQLSPQVFKKAAAKPNFRA